MKKFSTVAVAIIVFVSCEPRRSVPFSESDTDIDNISAPCPTNKVDLLFVIDNSCSMQQEQSVLADQFVILAQKLLNPTTQGTRAVTDLHVGVITPDMGTRGYRIQSCRNPESGDNGELQNTGLLEDCQSTYIAPDCDSGECPWLTHSTEYPDDGRDEENPPIWEDFRCTATIGTCGCGFEQQLEASLVALTTQNEPGGHNEGFLRDDSVLAVVYVSDEDDCSTPNSDMFDPQNDLGSFNVRCHLNQEELYPVERYHNAFVELRGGIAERVVVASIVGIPIDGSWEPADGIEALRAIDQIDPENPIQLILSCSTDMGAAWYPVRLAEMALSFGETGVLASICQTDWTVALSQIAEKIQTAMEGTATDCP